MTISISYAQLSFVVSPPAVDGTVFSSCNGVVFTASDFDNVVSFVRIKLLNPSRVTLVKFVTYSQLAVVVESPRKHLVFVVDIETMLVAAKDVDGVLRSNLLHFECLVVFVPCR